MKGQKRLYEIAVTISEIKETLKKHYELLDALTLEGVGIMQASEVTFVDYDVTGEQVVLKNNFEKDGVARNVAFKTVSVRRFEIELKEQP